MTNIPLAIIYIASTVITGYITYDFWKSKDGQLRRILIQLFAALAFGYLSSAVMLLSNVNMDIVYAVRSILVTIQMLVLLRLYYYIKWKH